MNMKTAATMREYCEMIRQKHREHPEIGQKLVEEAKKAREAVHRKRHEVETEMA